MSFIVEQDVRTVLSAQAAGDSKWSADTINSNIRSATAMLERACSRYFTGQTATKTFTTNGLPQIGLRGLRTATSVTLAGSALAADSTYWLLPDEQQSGVYTAIQFRAFTGRPDGAWWLSVPDWFDRNLDSPYYPGNYAGRGRYGSLPNDLAIAGDWGYTDALFPDSGRLAIKFLAAYLCLRPTGLLAGGQTTLDGGFFDLSNMPVEVTDFIREYKLDPQAIVSVG